MSAPAPPIKQYPLKKDKRMKIEFPIKIVKNPRIIKLVLRSLNIPCIKTRVAEKFAPIKKIQKYQGYALYIDIS